MRAIIASLLLSSAVANAQSTAAQSVPGPAALPSAQEQITQAVLPLPNDLRASATVLGYASVDGALTPLREGTGGMICLASNPRQPRWHVACYHKSLEPFMARGRQLRTEGVTGEQVDSVRFREAKSGTLKLPTEPAMLYSLTGDRDAYDPATRSAPKARPLFVVYMPNATSQSTGLSAVPAQGTPWIMFPGTPKAHIMFVPRMQ
jgi:hypothetical protein